MQKMAKRLQITKKKSWESIKSLLDNIREGKANATNYFLEEIQQTVFSFGMKVCGGDVEDAEDTMQEVLIKFFRGAKNLEFNDPRALRVWLYKVAKNACLMKRRKGKFEPDYILSTDDLAPKSETGERKEPNIPDWSQTPDMAAHFRENQKIIQDALLRIPFDYRLVLVLRDMEGLSTSETSEVLDISENNVKVRLYRARMKMRDEVAEYLNLIYREDEKFERTK